MPNRMVRVNELLKREIADLLFRELHEGSFDPAGVMITRVDTTPDLHHATVYVSVVGTPEQKMHVIRLMLKHRKNFQKRIGQDVRMKYTPQLSFKLDDSIQQGDRTLAILAELEREKTQKTENASEEHEPKTTNIS